MIVDTHCHIHDRAFADIAETVRVAASHAVWGAVAVGCDPETNARTLAAAAAWPKAIWPCLGFHPEWLHLTDGDLEAVERQVVEQQARLVGLGEIGLPWYALEGADDARALADRGVARLERLLALAARYDLAVSLHAPHGAAETALQALRRHDVERAVFHWHKAPDAVTRAIVDAGYLVSVTPEVVYRERDRDLVERVPLEALVVESDAPWKYGGEFSALASGPWLAARVAEEVAKIKRLPVDDVAVQLATNATRLFHLCWT